MPEPHSLDRTLLPPMTALRAFEAAARLGSFTLAADELHVTQGAVSRQVKLLEDQLGVALFERIHQRVVLTEAGRYYAGHVSQILGRLMAAGTQTLAVAAPDSKLHIGIIPTFCSRWVVPHLPEFLAQYPQLNLRISAVIRDRDMSFLEEECDAGLLVGSGPWSNTVSHWLTAEEIIPVAAPRWAAAHNIQSPEDLIGPPLLLHTLRPDLWPRWFTLNEIDPGALPPSHVALEQIAMIAEAVIAEIGAALLPRVLVARELKQGMLMELPGKSMHVSDGYFFVYPKHKEHYPPLVAFRSWLLQSFKQSI